MKLLDLKKENTRRIVFHEITKNAILKAIDNPRDIDNNLVDAQQARRVLDRLVGFELSPLLWRKIQPKLSAGRVQSVALRLVVDREKEIIDFKKENYYKVDAVFHPEGLPSNVLVNATLNTRFNSAEEAYKFLEDSKNATFKVIGMSKKEGNRFPAPPFTTSTLQQEAARKLHFPVSLTMRLAQQLYERGLITYMRTDSTNLSSLAIGKSKEFICSNFGDEYSHSRQYKTKSKGAQEAHEAIRPTYIENKDIDGTPQEKKLYSLIWKRTIASQMSEAKVLRTDIKVASDKREEVFSIQATQIIFDGFLKVYIEGKDEPQDEEEELILPEIAIGTILKPESITASSKFTSAPSRYSEASLVKKLEELGIGRPSTYAPIISTLTTGRGYLVKGDTEGEKIQVEDLILKNGIIKTVPRIENIGAEKGKLLPQEIGMIVSDYLVKNFETIMNYDFTADVEKDFDEIAEGEKVWNNVIAEFYTPFHKKVEEVLGNKEYERVSRELGKDPKDGQMIVAKFGQYGPYIQKGEGENRQFANLANGQLIENITLDQAIKLFELPRTVGTYNGTEIIATQGRFGPYLKFADKNISIPKGSDPLKISLEECISLIEESAKRTPANTVIKEFKESDIQVVNGRYGPYIKHDGGNYKIPKGIDIESLTEEKCKEIVSNTTPSGKRSYPSKQKKK